MNYENVRSEETLVIVRNSSLEILSGTDSVRSRTTFTHVILEVLATQRKLRPDITLIDAVNPSAHRYYTIEENRHPPSTAPEFQIECILGWRKIRAWRTAVMPCKCPGIIQTKGYRGPRLKTCEHPDLDPTALGIEVPRK
jgi:hypothetical protein